MSKKKKRREPQQVFVTFKHRPNVMEDFILPWALVISLGIAAFLFFGLKVVPAIREWWKG